MSKEKFKILVVDDENMYSKGLKKILLLDGYDIDIVTSPEEAIETFKRQIYQLVITDLMMKKMNGLELLSHINKNFKDTKVILMTAYATIPNAVEAMKNGAVAYYVKGNNPDELISEIDKVFLEYENRVNNELISCANNENEEIVLETKNKEFQKTIDMARKAAKTPANILLLGESGVGKEIFAKYIHSESERRKKPFVAVNCNAISENILESEFFGHKKGAFTGATSERIGRFEAANDGTLFLDEIADMPLSTQIKLLRVIETRTIEKLGSNENRSVDFRLISATNKSILNLIENGCFREDFYYRINTIIIEIKPLRSRKEDIPDLVNYFVQKASKEMNKEIKKIDDELLEYLIDYEYPGNIRELKNIVERLVVFSEDSIISKEDLLVYDLAPSDVDENQTLRAFRSDVEKKYIIKILKKNNGSMSKSAEMLAITRRQLQNKVNEYNIEK